MYWTTELTKHLFNLTEEISINNVLTKRLLLFSNSRILLFIWSHLFCTFQFTIIFSVSLLRLVSSLNITKYFACCLVFSYSQNSILCEFFFQRSMENLLVCLCIGGILIPDIQWKWILVGLSFILFLPRASEVVNATLLQCRWWRNA